VSKTLLVVDDENDIREVVQLSIALGTDWSVVAASSGAEALQTARVAQPDAILLDVMMPGLDGPATYQQLQDDAATQWIPVIFLTAKVRSSETTRLAALGVAGVLAKPFDPLVLPSQIAALLRWTL
jgi:two-component system alkaline phosphatase synthesis response regulator PhoP